MPQRRSQSELFCTVFQMGGTDCAGQHTRTQKVETGAPNVTQVVNNLQVKNPKASSS